MIISLFQQRELLNKSVRETLEVANRKTMEEAAIATQANACMGCPVELGFEVYLNRNRPECPGQAKVRVSCGAVSSKGYVKPDKSEHYTDCSRYQRSRKKR